MRFRFAALVVAALVFAGRAAIGQSMDSPSPQPSPPIPDAGVIPATISLQVSGSVVDGNFLDVQIRKALDRRIRPTLRAGSGVSYGPIVPWPLLPLASGARAAVNVTVRIAGDNTTNPVTGTATVYVDNVAVSAASPTVLFLSDDPEYVQSEGLIFRGKAAIDRPARLYYYHDDIGVPRDLDVVLTADAPTRLQLIESEAGPDLDVMSVGHVVSRDFLRFEQYNVGTVVDVAPGKPYIVRHALMLQGEVVAGAIDVHVVQGGAVNVSVVASPAGARPETFLEGPRVPFDGHQRHGTFDLTNYGNLNATYTYGDGESGVRYGAQTPTPRNLDPNDTGRDYGDYGVVHRITLTLLNPSDEPHLVYLYHKPLGGPVRGSFLIDGQLRELGCARMPQPYWLATYQLPAHSTSASTTLTMTDGGSFYPVRFGVTEAQPLPYTPPVGSPDGCSPVARSLDAPVSANH